MRTFPTSPHSPHPGMHSPGVLCVTPLPPSARHAAPPPAAPRRRHGVGSPWAATSSALLLIQRHPRQGAAVATRHTTLFLPLLEQSSGFPTLGIARISGVPYSTLPAGEALGAVRWTMPIAARNARSAAEGSAFVRMSATISADGMQESSKSLILTHSRTKWWVM